jgi:Xaa-Pro aminopeptidase
MYADTTRSAELRNEVPHTVHDPFLYIEHGGSKYTVLRSLEVARMAEVDGMTALPLEDFGLDELVASGLSGDAAALEIAVRACEQLGVARALVPPAFPVAHADRLRAAAGEVAGAAGGHPARADRRRGRGRRGRAHVV